MTLNTSAGGGRRLALSLAMPLFFIAALALLAMWDLPLRTRQWISIPLLLATAGAVTLTVLSLARGVVGALPAIVAELDSIAAGSLDNTIATSGPPAVAPVLESLARMQLALRKRRTESTGQIEAIHKVQAVIEFNLDGTIVTANDNFLETLGYGLEEIQGRHHSLFVDPAYRDSPEYQAFWAKLRRGEYDRGRYMRLGKGGRAVWIEASYNPIFGSDGKPYKIIKFATDVTEQVQQTRALEHAVEQTQHTIQAAINGDLTQRITLDGASGELRRMADAVNALLASVGEIVSRVQAAAGEVHRGAEEISQGNANLSQRTEEQSSSLEETASSMEEMTSTVKQNADNASQADMLASAAREQAARGGAVTDKAVEAMNEIKESSRRIVDIIAVIDELAFQTNLLALNAAVEAARAGEQGRGFGVVASEVRNLAGRSAKAAREIKELIQDSVKKVEDGSSLVLQSGQTLGQIVASVKKVSDIIAEISAASREQSSGIEQVNRAVMQMDQMTQQNAALVEQATASSQSMAQQARAMHTMLEKYRVEQATPERARPVRSPQPARVRTAMA